jgi:predicted transposase YbfD/YdcC
MEWKNIFDDVPDFRQGNVFKLHELQDILLLSLLATLAGAENDEEIATYGKEKQSFLSNYLRLPNGIPSHDTITRVFRYLDKDKFAECLHRYSKELIDFLAENHISIDGKICRATNKGGKKKNGICIITAWACEQNLCLGQLKTDEKSSEKTAIPALIEEIEIKNTVVSIDAIANSPSIAEQIIKKGGDYILSLKKNQKLTFEQVSDYMKTHESLFEMDENIDFGSGRIETRRCYVAKNLVFMEDTLAWAGIKSVVMIHAKREIRNKEQSQYRFYLSSKDENAKYFNDRIREHWSIENQLHWHLDVSFDEDRCRTKMGNGAENHNTLRKIALQILQQKQDKHSIKEKRKKAGWNNQYLIEIIKNVPL